MGRISAAKTTWMEISAQGFVGLSRTGDVNPQSSGSAEHGFISSKNGAVQHVHRYECRTPGTNADVQRERHILSIKPLALRAPKLFDGQVETNTGGCEGCYL